MHVQVDEDGRSLLRAAMRQLHMSARSARAAGAYADSKGPSHSQAGVDDLVGSDSIETAHLAEVIQYWPRW